MNNSIIIKMKNKKSFGFVSYYKKYIGIFSTVLGASEMNLIDLTNIYAVIWNNGESVHPYSITKIYSKNGSAPVEKGRDV